nr:MAG TPA: hypothetical protein [Caudoviricetes sp.]
MKYHNVWCIVIVNKNCNSILSFYMQNNKNL